MNRSRLLLVDDHPLVREALEARLRKCPDLEVVGSAGTGEEALLEVARLRPDLVVLDLSMPGMGGLQALKRIKADYPGTAVVVLTVSEAGDDVVQAVLAGAGGYLSKHSPPELLPDALRTVLSGGTTISSELLKESVRRLAGTGESPSPEVELKEPLSEREQQVLQLLVQGHSNKSIADTLSIVEATAKKHVHNLIRKLGVSDRTQAAVASIRMGLVEI